MSPDEPYEMHPEVAHASRMYDYLLGGTNNFEADRRAVEKAAAAVGGIEFAQADARANRDFLRRSIQVLAEAGVRQFLDIGCGIPNGVDDAHTVAFEQAPDARVVSVDNNAIVLASSHCLLRAPKDGAAGFVFGDLRDSDQVLGEAALTLDLTKPVGLLLVALLHHVPDAQEPARLVARLLDALAPGSYLAVTHLSNDLAPDGLLDTLDTESRDPFFARSAVELGPFMDGLDLLDPGLVPVNEWRPEPGKDTALPAGWRPSFYGAVAAKPEPRS